MIDEKKIEEAAYKYALEQFDEEWYDHKAIRGESFNDGINWFKENLWHDASEEPENDKDVLLETITSKGKSTFVRIIPFDWEFSVKRHHITRWLYIEDLMEGENNV